MFSAAVIASLHREFRPNELLDSFLSCQPQANQLAFVLQVNVKIKKRAAFALVHDPVCQFRQRRVLWPELKLVSLRATGRDAGGIGRLGQL